MSRLSRRDKALVAHLEAMLRQAVAEAQVKTPQAGRPPSGQGAGLPPARRGDIEVRALAATQAERDEAVRLAATWKDNAENAADSLAEALSRVRELETELDSVAADRRGIKAERDGFAQLVETTKFLMQAKVDAAELRIKALERDLEVRSADAAGLRRQIESLKAELAAKKAPPSGQVAGFPPPSAGGYKGGTTQLALTPLAVRVLELIAKGYSDRGICDIVNNGMEPPRWLNAAGVLALRELLIGGAA